MFSVRRGATLLVGLWFVLWGVTTLFGFVGLPGPVLAVIAIAAGIMIMVDR